MSDDTNESWLTREFARARARSAKLPKHARPVLVHPSAAREILAEGDTGEAILPVPVSAIAARLNASRVEAEKANGVGVHADRDGSEAREARLAPRGDNPSTSLPTARDAGESVSDEPVWGDVRHHRERIDQLNEWVRYWAAKARTAERALTELRIHAEQHALANSGCVPKPAYDDLAHALANERAKLERVEAYLDGVDPGVTVQRLQEGFIWDPAAHDFAEGARAALDGES